MPIGATHIRFALDWRDRYKIKDLGKYIAGAIYPDSYCFTGIDRALTHDDKFLDPQFASDDFKKGWQSHKLCDKAYMAARANLFPDLLPVINNDFNEEEWVISTAIKVILDIEDRKRFDIKEYLGCLNYTFNPNNEDLGLVRKYNQLMIEKYKTNLGIDDSVDMRLMGGSRSSLGGKIKTKTRELSSNQEIMSRINKLYSEIFNISKKLII